MKETKPLKVVVKREGSLNYEMVMYCNNGTVHTKGTTVHVTEYDEQGIRRIWEAEFPSSHIVQREDAVVIINEVGDDKILPEL